MSGRVAERLNAPVLKTGVSELWKGARVVEWTGLENRQERKLFVGSNPTPSAKTTTYVCPAKGHHIQNELCTRTLGHIEGHGSELRLLTDS